jgi:hypothetical protein
MQIINIKYNHCSSLFHIDTHCSKEKEKQWKIEWWYNALFASLNITSLRFAIMLKHSFQYTLYIETRDPKDVSTKELIDCLDHAE